MRSARQLMWGIALCLAAPASAQKAPADVAAAVAATGARSADNLKLDEGRKPAELLAFMGLQQGMDVLDMFGANLYWAEIMAPAVGAGGSVTIWQPSQFLNDKRRAGFVSFRERQPNTLLLSSPFGDPRLGTARYDFILMNLDYHDVYWQSEQYKIAAMEPDQWLKAVYAAARPGATVAIIDHVGAPGDTRTTVDKLHRIDPAVVRADFERAGFVLDGQSPIYANPADDHTVNVFDAAIRGKTDRFAFRFKKPE